MSLLACDFLSASTAFFASFFPSLFPAPAERLDATRGSSTGGADAVGDQPWPRVAPGVGRARGTSREKVSRLRRPGRRARRQCHVPRPVPEAVPSRELHPPSACAGAPPLRTCGARGSGVAVACAAHLARLDHARGISNKREEKLMRFSTCRSFLDLGKAQGPRPRPSGVKGLGREAAPGTRGKSRAWSCAERVPSSSAGAVFDPGGEAARGQRPPPEFQNPPGGRWRLSASGAQTRVQAPRLRAGEGLRQLGGAAAGRERPAGSPA